MEQTARIVSFPGLGLEFQVNRVAFQIGSMPIYWYGILIALGFILAILYVLKRSKDFGVDSDRMLDVIMGGAIGGIIGARLYFVAFKWEDYSKNLALIFDTRSGGMAIYGGVIFGFLAGYLMCKWRKVKFLPGADLVANAFLLGQGIGRWGNFINIEAFGSNTSLPWGMSSPVIVDYLSAHEAELEAIGMNIDPNMPVHPTFLYESIWCLLGFVLIGLYAKHRRFDGELILFYAVWYGSERMVVEGLRTDSLLIPGTTVRVSQILATLLVVAAAAIWITIRMKMKKANDPDYLRLYVTTEEAAQIAAGTFYDTKAKTETTTETTAENVTEDGTENIEDTTITEAADDEPETETEAEQVSEETQDNNKIETEQNEGEK